MSDVVRTRFAPSPTGYLHVGGARTALFNWLYAKRHGGKFILRVEDTDRARNTQEAVSAIYEGLHWLGLDWDEGPGVGGAYGPYAQSERNEIYERYLQRLQDAGRVYEDGGSIRFRFERKSVIVDDLVSGRVEMDMSDASTNPDMTIRRPDGGWIFHFVNVVDDIEMAITHVIRGEDHLSNTPKHIQLYEAFGVNPPQFAHIPLILNADGSKMSKRDQGSSIQSYIEGGYLPEAVRNYLCLLGWSPKDNREKMPIEEVIRLFDFDKINRRGAQFDMGKLLWLQGEYARELDPDRFLALGMQALVKSGLPVSSFSPDYVEAALRTCIGKIKTFTELATYAGFYFVEEYPFDETASAKHFTPENRPVMEAIRSRYAEVEPFDAASLEAALKGLAAERGTKVGALVHPTRLAVTGNTAGPSLYHLLEVLGREKVLSRLDRALATIPQA
jgi:glutamyl-tRNA synthetase